ncbi:MAG: hypothetical protein E7458_04145 [Ruminococcaceae bacterium]|nr:hypothetical protein [Oscillospiraceae bacterium]
MDYRIEAISVLLREDCITARYFPLIPYKESLLHNLLQNQHFTKSDCLALSEDTLLEMGLPSLELAGLFHSFLVMYDAKPGKFKEIGTAAANEAEAASFRELYLLPGVKAVRAKLYYDAGYQTLESIASALPEEIIAYTSDVIRQKGLPWKAPLPKEVRTHIAVAKAFTIYAV